MILVTSSELNFIQILILPVPAEASYSITEPSPDEFDTFPAISAAVQSPGYSSQAARLLKLPPGGNFKSHSKNGKDVILKELPAGQQVKMLPFTDRSGGDFTSLGSFEIASRHKIFQIFFFDACFNKKQLLYYYPGMFITII